MADTIPSEPPAPSTSPATRFRLPAEYYAAPPSEVRPIFPRWAPAGCGIASLVFLLVLFVGGALLTRYGMGKAMDFVLGMMETELVRTYAKDVTGPQKESLSRELTLLRENLRSERIAVPALEPVMKSLRDATADEKLTSAEVAELVARMEKVNERAQASRTRPAP